MKLFYYKDEVGNFGDDLNPWLWDQIASDIIDEDESELFVGIGTLLNHRLPAEPIKHIFGSGLGYGRNPVVDDKWKIHALRGPYTAKELPAKQNTGSCVPFLDHKLVVSSNTIDSLLNPIVPKRFDIRSWQPASSGVTDFREIRSFVNSITGVLLLIVNFPDINRL